jgi:hypothetical protein
MVKKKAKVFPRLSWSRSPVERVHTDKKGKRAYKRRWKKDLEDSGRSSKSD